MRGRTTAILNIRQSTPRIASPVSGAFLPGWFQYFNPRVPIWQDSPPGDVGIGQEIGVHVRYWNTAAVVQNMTAYVYIYDPGGTEVARKEPQPIAVAPNGNYGTILTTKNTQKLGDYIAKALLYADGELVDTWEGLIAVTISGQISGDLWPNYFFYWNEQEKNWMKEPPTADRTSVVGIEPHARSTGTGTQLMTIETTIKNPNGHVLTLVVDKSLKPSEADPREPQTVEPTEFLQTLASAYIDIPGTYTAECKLIADGQIVDTWEGPISIVAEVVKPPGEVPIWPFILSGVGLGLLGGILVEPKLRPIAIPLGGGAGAGIGYAAYKIYRVFQ